MVGGFKDSAVVVAVDAVVDGVEYRLEGRKLGGNRWRGRAEGGLFKPSRMSRPFRDDIPARIWTRIELERAVVDARNRGCIHVKPNQSALKFVRDPLHLHLSDVWHISKVGKEWMG